MTTNKTERRDAVRYSEAFKLSVVRELEAGGLAFGTVARKYGIKGASTVQNWVGKYGNGTRGKIVRVEKPNEINQLKQLQQRVRLLEGTVGSLHVELALERAYTEIACERAGIADVAGFKKKSGWAAAHQAVSVAGVTVAAVCRHVGISRQNYYAQRTARQKQAVDAALIVALVQAERRVQPRLGARKLLVVLAAPLAEAGVKVGRDRFLAVLRQGGLLLEPLPGEYPRTTDSYHCLPVFTNLVKELVLSGPNEAWVSDLTYVRTEEGFLYLALVTDKYSRKIVGYHCGDTLEAIGCVQALAMALQDLPEWARPIHHSDQGCQYCCHEYVNALTARGLKISMTVTDHCAENALAERMNGILKSEYGLGGKLKTKAQARQLADQAVHLYNTRRPHTALAFQTPAVVHGLAA